MILATVDTGSFAWVVLAENRLHANRLLLRAYGKHCEQNPDADPALMSYAISEEWPDYVEVEVGTVLRDGSPLR